MNKTKKIQKSASKVSQAIAEYDKYTGLKRTFLFFIFVLRKTIQEFTEIKGVQHASSLTYFSILSTVPLLGVGFGIAKGFGFENVLKENIRKGFSQYQDVIDELLVFSDNILNKTSGGLISGLGLLFLFYSVYSMLNNIEGMMNTIWKVKKSRTIVRKISDYFSLILVTPLFFILANGITTLMQKYSGDVHSFLSFIPFVEYFIIFIIKAVPFFLIGMMITFLFMIIPNTKVKFRSAFFAGLLTGTAYYIVQWIFIFMQVGVSRYNAIYGSFAAIPLFIVWVQVSWSLIVIGNIFNYTLQYHTADNEIEGETKVSSKDTKIISLFILRLISKRFEEGKAPYSMSKIYLETGINKRIVNYIMSILLEEKFIQKVVINQEKGEYAFQPAMNVHKLTLYQVFNTLEEHSKEGIDTSFSEKEEAQIMEKNIEEIKGIISNSENNKPILEL